MTIPRVLEGRRRRLYARLVAIGAGRAGVAVGLLHVIRHGFNRLTHHTAAGSSTDVVLLGAGLIALAGLGAWLELQERVQAERLGQHYTHALRMTLYARLATLAPRSLQRRSRGVVAMRFVGDLNAVRQWVSLGLARVTVSAIYALGAIVALAALDPLLALAVGLALGVGGVLSVRLGGELRETARTARRRRAQLATNINEKVFSMAVVHAFGQIEREQKRLRRQSNRLREAMIANARATGRNTAMSYVTGALATAAALVIGSLEVSAGRTSAGSVVAAMSVVGLMVPAIRDLGRVQQYWHNSRVALAAIQRFLDTPSLLHEKPGAPDLTAGGEGRLELVDVGFGDAVKGVSATAEAGSVVAVVGPNGAGKSTLLALAARLMDPERGSVLLDGEDLADHSLTSIRAAISIAGPDLPLGRGTIAMNLRYRWPEAPPEELSRVRALCRLDEVLARMPDGENTRLAEQGAGLSEGERQRIALARALVGRPRLLLLDEVDAGLDAEATEIVDRIIDAQRGNTTVLIATHRRDRAAAVDSVWRLEAGRLTISSDRRAPVAS